MTNKLTQNELKMLLSIYNEQNTDSCGNYKVETNEEKGLIGSLVKKELIYDSYEGYTFGKNWQFSKYSFCCTMNGIQVLSENGFDVSHLIEYYELYQS
jgi:hypothetical protein